jgi:uncharacterized membrane protein HdeD (DUF308 family)
MTGARNMTDTINEARGVTENDGWLTRYYFARAAFSVLWVGAAFGLAHSGTAVVAGLLLIYPAWDALANLVDAQHNGGLRRNPTQTFNLGVSTATTIAVGIALAKSMNAVLGVFGVWAALSGVLQLATAVRRRRRHGGQWPMMLSGVQSAAAGIGFVLQANSAEPTQITAIAPYAGFGAFYFAIAAVWLVITAARRRNPMPPAGA